MIAFVSLILLSIGYFNFKIPPKIKFENLPQREVFVSIKIDQPHSFEDKYGRQSGIATIIDTPAHLKFLKNQPIYYFLNAKEPLIRTSVLQVKAILSEIVQTEQQSFDRYLLSQHIQFRLTRGHVLKVLIPAKSFYQFCVNQNNYLSKILFSQNTQNDNSEAKIYAAMLLGNKSTMEFTQKEAFRKTGTLHLFAISGLHVAVIASCLAMMLRFLHIKTLYTAIIGLLILFLYVQVTGATPSAMRAFLMVFFYWGARAFLRKKEPFSALLASAFVVLLVNPLQLWNIGFQLSYAVVSAIVLYGLPLQEIIYKKITHYFNAPDNVMHIIFRKSLGAITGTLCISIAAALGSFPLALLYFKIVTPGAIPLNMIIMPISSIVIILGFLSLLGGLFFLTPVSNLLNFIATYGVFAMEYVVKYSLQIPYLFLETVFENYLFCVFFMFIILTWCYLGHSLNLLKKFYYYVVPVLFVVCYAVYVI